MTNSICDLNESCVGGDQARQLSDVAKVLSLFIVSWFEIIMAHLYYTVGVVFYAHTLILRTANTYALKILGALKRSVPSWPHPLEWTRVSSHDRTHGIQ